MNEFIPATMRIASPMVTKIEEELRVIAGTLIKNPYMRLKPICSSTIKTANILAFRFTDSDMNSLLFELIRCWDLSSIYI